MAVVDDEDRPVAPGIAGEIVVRGPMVFNGYWNCVADNAFTFRGGWHHTGDMGRFDADGYLWYVGRSAAKELIKPGGENVYPAEVERALLEHPALSEAVVFGVPDAQWGEAIKAVCVLKPGQTVTLETDVPVRASAMKRTDLVATLEYVKADGRWDLAQGTIATKDETPLAPTDKPIAPQRLLLPMLYRGLE